MPLYTYQALSKEGKKMSGQLDASSAISARDMLMKKGLYPVKIAEASAALAGWNWRALFRRGISVKDKIFFTKQLAMLLKSGVPLLHALELLVGQTEGRLKNIVVSLKDDIKEGRSLADALNAFPRVFDNTYVQLVKAGEASGKLDIILLRLTTYLERIQEMRRRIRSALSYPIFQLVFIGAIVMLLLTFVVPTIADTLATENVELPTSTVFLLALSGFIRGYWWLMLAVIVLMYFLYRWWRSTPRGSYSIDSLKLRIPLVRYFSRMGTVVRFSRTLGMLIEGGVNLAEALTIVSDIVDNQVLAKVIDEAKDSIIKQGRIAEYLKKTNIFPSTAIYLINTGEQSGELGAMLLTVAEYYEIELSDLADSLSSKLGPIMTIVMAVVVGFIIMAIVTPIMQMGLIAEGI